MGIRRITRLPLHRPSVVGVAAKKSNKKHQCIKHTISKAISTAPVATVRPKAVVASDDCYQRSEKRVRFITEPTHKFESNVEREVIVSMKKQLWLTKKEGSALQSSARDTARKFGKQHRAVVDHFKLTLEKSNETTFEASKYLQGTELIIPAYVRGLEAFYVPALKTQRKKHVRHILNAQEQIRGRLSAEMRIRLLGIRSTKSSRSSRVIARLLGEGDASVVQTKLPNSRR